MADAAPERPTPPADSFLVEREDTGDGTPGQYLAIHKEAISDWLAVCGPGWRIYT